MKTARILKVSLILGIISVTATVGQDVPQLINYQGYLMEDGQPYEGYAQITFSIYDGTEVATPLWSETQTVTVTKGYYNVLLGSLTSFPDTLFVGSERYLGIKVGTEEEEMAPRVRIASVGFALNADRLDGQDGSDFLFPTNWTAFPFANGYGNYGLGHQSPQYRKIGDIVYLRGLLKDLDSAIAAGSTVGTLPAGFRPPARLLFSQGGHTQMSRVDIDTAGNVIVITTQGYNWLSLDGIMFSTQ